MTDNCFVLDTSVLLHDPQSIQAFPESRIVVPIYVIEELDTFKDEPSKRGRNAREASRLVESLRIKGSLASGVQLGSSIVQVLSLAGDSSGSNDNKILALASEICTQGSLVTLISRDINLRIKADSNGLKAQDYQSKSAEVSNSNIFRFAADPKLIEVLFLEGNAPLKWDVEENSFGILNEGTQESALVRFKPSKGIMIPVKGTGAWGIQARNKEQHFALDLLLDDNIKLVALTGPAGVGKSILAVAAALEKVIEARKYRKLVVSKPIIPIGQDLGYLPGTLREKLSPWIQSVYDSLYVLMNISEKDRKKGRTPDELFDIDAIDVQPITYIRGRSLPNQLILLDEGQNTSIHELKTLITRAGENTKIVLTGDTSQIDTRNLNSFNNGLTQVINKFRGQKIFGHVNLIKGERSELAEIASKLL